MNLRVTLVNVVFVRGPDPRALLSRFRTLPGLARALARWGRCAVTVVQRFPRDDRLEEDDVSYRFVADGDREHPGLAARLPRAAAAVAATRPDVVHLNGLSFPGALLSIRRAAPGSLFVVQDHAGRPEDGVRGLFQRLATPRADGFLFTAADQAARWRERGLLGDRPVHEVVEGSCDFAPRDRDVSRAATGVGGVPALLWVGRLHPRKDPLTALRGFGRVGGRLPGATLTMIFGEAPLRAEVEAFLAGSPELSGRVRLVGPVPHGELPAWYSAADLFLTSSPEEGSNYALVEAMACGTRPVASDIPVHRRIAGEAAGYFVAGDPDSCADALLRAAMQLSPADRAAVRIRFEETASWPAVARQARAAYDSLLVRSRGGNLP